MGRYAGALPIEEKRTPVLCSASGFLDDELFGRAHMQLDGAEFCNRLCFDAKYAYGIRHSQGPGHFQFHLAGQGFLALCFDRHSQRAPAKQRGRNLGASGSAPADHRVRWTHTLPTTDGERPLLWVLRTDLGLTGTKFGCGQMACGACTVLVDDRPTRSCMFPVRGADGTEITTIEGLDKNGQLHPLQKAFMQHDALQCGFCTSGMIMQAYGLLLDNPEPTRDEIIRGMDDNLCRCGAHTRIIEAIQTAAKEMKGAQS